MTTDNISDERRAEVTNSRIKSGLKGVTSYEDGRPGGCEHPYCDREQSPRLQRPEGVYDTLCWRHRTKRGAYNILTNAAIATPFATVAWLADSPVLLAASVLFVVVVSAANLLADDP